MSFIGAIKAASVGLVLALIIGGSFEYSNYLLGNSHWINFPSAYGPYLSITVFGTVPIGLLLAYALVGGSIGAGLYAFGTISKLDDRHALPIGLAVLLFLLLIMVIIIP